ncbi:MAG: molybdopterin-dependent oxidoreductase [Methanobacteriaceae archaeon]|nr:molybdopterin-dependent oxidoreductase [Methanobacteriaceae archaeon]MDP2835706.1 molybdopterin-dependent oxidoreductase [Methanobacteriaceae archaeon]MDP3035022.1 molybdopterin-dependent oxidoreductase [Methanobacteriaceae archaeon]MDP3484035.1 molybdopterin-dependent oxidoreductase [Methanobacteriaceae archaeon]MDP3624547.1 molybdopterin-dependent oxidoreductase [Methanobacteriaceae archaeon]
MYKPALISILLLIGLISFFTLNAFLNPDVTTLDSIQIKNYKGQKLSSINEFHENSIKGPQKVNINNYTLQVTGRVQNPQNYTYKEIISHKNYQKVVTLNCVEGWSVTILWRGILVSELINKSKPTPDGKTVIFYATDGYSTSFPLDYMNNNHILMAYKMNNVTIPPERGFPFQLVAESKWGYKWVKWITKIEISNNTNYTGYWESRGYSNTGNLNESFSA